MRARLVVGDEDRVVEFENVAISSSESLEKSLSKFMAGAEVADDGADSTSAVDEVVGIVATKRGASVRRSVPHLLT